MKKKWIAMAAALLAAAGVQAQTALPAYVEVGYTAIDYSEDGFPDVKLGAARAILGLAVHPNVALEAMVAAGVKDDTVRFQGIDVTAKVDGVYGFFVKPKINATPQLELFGRLGYVKTRFKASAVNVSVTDSDGDAAYGVGLAYTFTNNAYLAADYTSYFDKDGVKASGVSLGVGFRF